MSDFDSSTDPIDIVEALAEVNNWEFQRNNQDGITLIVNGLWASYNIHVERCVSDNTLHILLTSLFTVKRHKRLRLYELINFINKKGSSGAFSFIEELGSFAHYTVITFSEDSPISEEQTENLIISAVDATDYFYPALLSFSAGSTPSDALEELFANPYVRKQ